MSPLQRESATCPSCGRDLYSAICPNCGVSPVSDSDLQEAVKDAEPLWVREFSLLWNRVRINGGLEEGFVQTGWKAGGLSEVTTYSKGWWLVINLGAIVMMALFTALLVVIESMDPAAELGVPLILVGVFTTVYAVGFYYVTFVPPKS